jgi:L-seryl-tRNA(Ser) seleniumtransferase
MATEARRRIPSLDALLRSDAGKHASVTFGRTLVKASLARTLSELRAAAKRGDQVPSDDVILARALRATALVADGLTRVINATGVVLHTGLGRAPLPPEAARAAAEVAAGYSDLELDRETGGRGRRSSRAEAYLTAITGAEDALVVNNGAAAVMLVLAALARAKQVLVSRGELIEIGGEFRIPDIMAASGAKLVEVGTTNRTRAKDFRSAISDRTALFLKVHPSNYRVVGFTAEPSARELADLAHANGIAFAYDLGSGLFERPRGFPTDEPTAAEALASGADVVVFSGDKLLGASQAGVILGRAAVVERLRRHPIARAVRVDKLQIAALERVLSRYATGRLDEIPVWRMLREPAATTKRRAAAIASGLQGIDGVRVERCVSTVGGGSMPGYELPSFAVAVEVPDPNAMAARLRTGTPPVFARVGASAILLDVRTIADDEVQDAARAVRYALDDEPAAT